MSVPFINAFIELLNIYSGFTKGTDNITMNNNDNFFLVILEKPIRIPRSLSVRAASCLKGFLNKVSIR